MEICERDGWVAECPACKHNFKATILKPWGGSWIIFYSKSSNIIYLDDYNGSENIIDYLGNKLFDDFIDQKIELNVEDFNINFGPRCPNCNQILNGFENVNPDSVIWIDRQVLLDGKIKKSSCLSVNVK
jgi:hypothetical protein